MQNNSIEIWTMAIRPKTLMASIAPVMLGTLMAYGDGQAGLQELAGNATMLFYMSEEGQEGRNAFVQKRKPDFSKFPKRP